MLKATSVGLKQSPTASWGHWCMTNVALCISPCKRAHRCQPNLGESGLWSGVTQRNSSLQPGAVSGCGSRSQVSFVNADTWHFLTVSLGRAACLPALPICHCQGWPHLLLVSQMPSDRCWGSYWHIIYHLILPRRGFFYKHPPNDY